MNPRDALDYCNKHSFKIEPERVEEAELSQYSGDVQATSNEVFDEKRLLRKIDLHLFPWLFVPCLLCFLDRTGIGNARVSLLVLSHIPQKSRQGPASCMEWRRISISLTRSIFFAFPCSL